MRIERVGETHRHARRRPALGRSRAERSTGWTVRGCKIHRLDWASGERRDWDVPAMIGSMALPRGRRGRSLRSRPASTPSISRPARQRPWPTRRRTTPATRFNDGKVDRQGRFLTGHHGDADRRRGARLHLLSGHGPLAAPAEGRRHRCQRSPASARTAKPSISPIRAGNAIFAYDYDTATGDYRA